MRAESGFGPQAVLPGRVLPYRHPAGQARGHCEAGCRNPRISVLPLGATRRLPFRTAVLAEPGQLVVPSGVSRAGVLGRARLLRRVLP